MGTGYLDLYSLDDVVTECHMCHRPLGPDRITVSQYEGDRYHFDSVCSWNCAETMTTVRNLGDQIRNSPTADESYDI
jgi:hypothetical protein